MTRRAPPPIVFMFPGQSSRSRSMFARAIEVAPRVALETFERASDVLGRDVRAICDPNRSEWFVSNLDVQVGVFVANHIHARALEACGIRADLSLGLSLGEYNHLVQLGALRFEDALRLVDARGEAYDAGPSGAMAVVFPLPLDELEPLILKARVHGDLAVSNINSPTQHVVGGEHAAIDALMSAVEDETFANATVIEKHIPMHTPRFRPVSDSFGEALSQAPWQPTAHRYLPNVTGEFVDEPSGEAIADLLRRHVYEPVQWQRSVEAVVADHPSAVFVEAGPGRVLAGLMRRSWLDVPRHITRDGEQFALTVAALGEEALAHGG